ncbi:MAG: hypothetical protein KGL70_13100 [Betaproteobacteria bacterium]|nr:hypothetical protein [Betaproteobacteria bacterium]MDE2002084.1 hypothetical protein [Betaproteobacteria bacterium]MDE2210543.1 hypothetical protein [Betaproteobacteria bacterium]MDE2360308.1 hypothetical protein [Betaproteobacteria bacterium]
MQLLDELKQRLDAESSLFRAQLLREDIARLTKLGELARSTGDFDAFRKAAMHIGWTQGDARTQELAGPLGILLEAVYPYFREDRSGTAGECGAAACDPAQEARIAAAWHELHRVRMERLVGCLSNPVPRPAD